MTTTFTSNNKLKTVGHKHEAIMQWLILNPEASLAQCAAEFGLSQPYLSIVIHSHAFQDKFAQFRDEYYGTVAQGLEEKLNGLAHLAMDRVMEKVEESDNPDYLAGTLDKVLGRLGFGGGKTPSISISASGGSTVQVVSREALEEAEKARQALRARTIEGEALPPEGESSA